ncbi:hypothetical protein MY5147_009658 [Beauveria neobassiana]
MEALPKSFQALDQGLIYHPLSNSLLGLPKTLREDFANSMKAIAYKYNEDLISKIRADDMVQRYPGYVKAIAWATPDSTLYYDSRQRMWRIPARVSSHAAQYLYPVGVAAGVDDPPPRRINPNSGPSLFGCLELQYARHCDNQYGMQVLAL